MILPSVTKKANQDWLLNNQEVFLEFMATHHSLQDVLHTYLHYETFNDDYVEKMITEIEKSLKKKEAQEKAILKSAKKDHTKKDPIKERNDAVNKAVQAKRDLEDDDWELPE